MEKTDPTPWKKFEKEVLWVAAKEFHQDAFDWKLIALGSLLAHVILFLTR